MEEPILSVVFYRSDAGKEPVRDWLRELTVEDRKAIGADIKTCLLYTSPSPRDLSTSRMPSSA